MVDFRYKAYLSYSHQDERWATWLHRSLESYRVSARLAAASGDPTVRRVAPVFRDREDLSSASDLSARLTESLAESESLIVLCSPAAAQSRWVNEEIRQFRALGRADRVFCMIVEGNPASASGHDVCFPPALFEDDEDRTVEPLASDPREHADGKRLALQKLLAGLLNVPLDAIRQRDRSRRRRWQVAAAVAVLVAVALTGYAISAGIAERQERERAEQLASFVVDLGNDLQDQLDLEALGRISTTALGFFEQLDPDQLPLDLRLRVGLALRQIADVNFLQGNVVEAGDTYRRSLELFEELNASHPGNDDVLFELSQAEFYLGDFLRWEREIVEARVHLNRYHDLAQAQHEQRPEDRIWLLELSYAKSALVNFEIYIGEPIDETVLAALEENLGLAGEALAAWEGDEEVMAHYGNELAFTADAYLGSCRLEEAVRASAAATEMAQRLTDQAPNNRDYQMDLAWRHMKRAQMDAFTGNLPELLRHHEAAETLVANLLSGDPSSQLYEQELAYNRIGLARAYRLYGRFDAASEALSRAISTFEVLVGLDSSTAFDREALLLAMEEKILLSLARGSRDEAVEGLERQGAVFESLRGGEEDFLPRASRMTNHRYLTWRLSGTDPAQLDPRYLSALPEPERPFRSCIDADVSARHAFLVGEEEALRRQLAYLEAAGYRNPDFMAFCRDEGLCDDAGNTTSAVLE